MKILPVVKNIPWTNNFLDVPKLWNVNKLNWLLKHYLNNSDDTIFDDVPLQLKSINSDRLNAEVRLTLSDLKSFSSIYSNWTIYDMLAVNYFITDEGQYFFVKKGDGSTILNGETITYQLELDSWMTNLEGKIVNDNKLRYIKKGHANRFLKKPTENKYNFDFSRDNPNWNKIDGPEPTTEILGKSFLSSNFDVKKLEAGTEILGKKEVYKILNDFSWAVFLVPLTMVEPDPDPLKSKLNYKNGLTICNKDKSCVKLPYQLMILPIFTNNARITWRLENRDWNLNAFLQVYTQTSSEILNAGVIKGLSKGSDVLSNIDDSRVKIQYTTGNRVLNLTGPDREIKNFDKSNLPDPNKSTGTIGTGNYCSMIIKKITYGDEFYSLFETLPNEFFENATINFQSKTLNETFKNDLPDIFNKEWDIVDLDINNPKDYNKEPSIYNSTLKINFNSNQQTKQLSYQLLKGEKPSVLEVSSFLEGIETTRKIVSNGYYSEYKYDLKHSIIENKTNYFSMGSSKFQDFQLQNQAQHNASMVSAQASTGATSALAILGILGAGLTGGLSLIGTAAAGTQTIQSGLSLKEKKSQMVDLKNQPSEIRNTGSNLINILTTDLTVQNDYIIVEGAVDSDLKFFYDEVYENGVRWDFRYSIKWDSRYWFNYWQIIDMNKTIDPTGLNPDEIELINVIFNKGVRLWNIRTLNQELDLNKFDKENLEMEIYNNGTKKVLRLKPSTEKK